MSTMTAIAKELNIHTGTVSKILNEVPGHRASKETTRKVFNTARRLGFNLAVKKFTHRREFPRKQIKLAALLQVKTNGSYTEFRGTTRDVSVNGVMIECRRKDFNVIPLAATIRLRIGGGPFGGSWLDCEVVRLAFENGSVGICLRPDFGDGSLREDMERYVSDG